MLNLNDKKLKSKFIKIGEYGAFVSFINDFYDRCKQEYDFLGLSEATWDNIFNRGLEKYAEEKVKNFNRYITKVLENYIRKEFESKKIRIFKNLMIKLQKTKSRNLLMDFLKRLSDFGLDITEEYFELMKKEIPTFKELLASKYLNTYQEFQAFKNGEYDIYYALKNRYHTLQETIIIVDYFVSLIPDLTLKKLSKEKDTLRYKKIKYIIDNYQDLEKLHELYQKKFGLTPRGVIDKTILEFSLEEIIKMFNDLKMYIHVALESNKDDMFLHRIYNRIRNNNQSEKMLENKGAQPKRRRTKKERTFPNKMELNVDKRAEVKPEVSDTQIKDAEKTASSEKLNPKPKKKIYDYFPDYEGITLEYKIELIDRLLSSEPNESIEKLLKYVNREIKSRTKEGRSVLNHFNNLRKKYEKMVKEELNPEPKKRIYDYFPDYEGVTLERKIELIDKLLSSEPKEKIEKLLKYVNEEIRYRTKEGRGAYNYLSRTLQNKYEKIVEEELNPQPKKRIYDYFPDYEGVTLERKIELIDGLLSSEPNEKVENLMKYVNEEVKRASKEGKITKRYLYNNLRKKYEKIVEEELNPQPKKRIYDYFVDYEEITLERKIELIDGLLSSEPKEKIDNLLKYLNREIKSTTKEGREAYNYLSRTLQNKYEKIVKKELNSKSKKKIYDYFPDYEGITLEHKIELIDSLLSSEPKESIEKLLKYVNREIKSTTKEGRSVLNHLNNLRKKYEKMDKEELNPKPKKRIYDYFPDCEGVTLEHKIELIDKLLSSEPKEKVENLLKYLNGEIKASSKKGKKAYSYLSRTLQNKYEKIVKEELNPKPKKRIYDYFPDYEGITLEHKIELIDKLLSSEPKEKVENLMKYVNEEVKSTTKEWKMAYSYLYCTLHNKYQKMIKEGLNPNLKKRVYDYFPDYEGITLEHKIELIDKLLSSEPKEKVENLLKYLNGKLKASSKEWKKAYSYLSRTLQNKYQKMIKEGLNPKTTKSVYDYFADYEKITLERKIELIDELLSSEPKEKVEKFLKYVNGEIKIETPEGKSAYNYFYNNLRKKYQKQVEEELRYLQEKVTKEPKNEILCLLFKKLDIASQSNIIAYFKGDDCYSHKALQDLALLKEEYNIFKEKYISNRNNYITEDTVLFIAEIIKNVINIDLFPSLSVSKILLLNDALKLIEYQYRTKNSASKEMYLQYLTQKIGEIITINPDYNLEQLITTYINLTYQALMPQEDILEKN